jgi:transcriptional regulator with XRE-family HTH domain
MNEPLEVFRELKRLRCRKGWTQAQTAERLGVKPRTLRAWEQGTRYPKPIVLRVIAGFIAQNQ